MAAPDTELARFVAHSHKWRRSVPVNPGTVLAWQEPSPGRPEPTSCCFDVIIIRFMTT